jgi:O-antigen/teichoic acid export membrane protein
MQESDELAFRMLKLVSKRVTVAAVIVTLMAVLVVCILFWYRIVPTLTLTTTLVLLLGTLPISLVAVWGEFVRALDHSDVSVIMQWLLPPALFIVLVLILIPKGSVTRVSVMYVFSYCVIMLYSIGWVCRKVRIHVEKKIETGFTSQVSPLSIPLWNPSLLIVSVLFVTNGWLSSMLLAYYVDMKEVALFNVAFRVSSVIVLVLSASNSYFGPFYASAYTKGSMTELGNLSKTAVRANTIICMPVLIVLYIFAPELLFIFGENYVSASRLLRVLIIGQIANVLSGPVSQLLMMTGHDKAQRNSVLLSGFLTSLLLVVFTPLWGLDGAGFAISVGSITVSVYAFYQAKFLLKINPSAF